MTTPVEAVQENDRTAGAVTLADLFDPLVGHAVLFVFTVAAIPFVVCLIAGRLFREPFASLPHLRAVVAFTAFSGAIVGLMAGISREPVIAAILTGLFGLVGAVGAMMSKADLESRGVIAGGAAAFLFSMFLANYGSTINRTEVEMFDRCIAMLMNPDADAAVVRRTETLCRYVNALPPASGEAVFVNRPPTHGARIPEGAVEVDGVVFIGKPPDGAVPAVPSTGEATPRQD